MIATMMVVLVNKPMTFVVLLVLLMNHVICTTHGWKSLGRLPQSPSSRRRQVNGQKQIQGTRRERTPSVSSLVFRPSPPSPSSSGERRRDSNNNFNNNVPSGGGGVMNSAAAATLNLVASFLPEDNSKYAEDAARVQLNVLPPTSIQLDLDDIPILGNVVSGTWVKIVRSSSSSNKNKQPNNNNVKPASASVIVSSPKEKFGAIRKFLERGRLGFDISGMLTTHVDLDVEPNQSSGEAYLKLTSNLIPKWPFGRRGRNHEWNRVTNMGSGETYYFNSETGQSQYDPPPDDIF